MTRTHETRRGGVHLLFRFDPAHPIGCTAGRLAPAIDSRGVGGYCIWWPAAGGRVLHDMPLAILPLLPAWLAEELANKPARAVPNDARARCDGYGRAAESRLSALVRAVALSPEGSRNRVLFWAACRCAGMVADGTLAPSSAEAVLIAAGQHAGLSERQARATAQSGLCRAGADGR